MARVYADVNQQMPRAYWDYDSVNITWGVLENYEVVRKIGMDLRMPSRKLLQAQTNSHLQVVESIPKSSRVSTSPTTRNV
jgi:hypothetical protein